MSWKQRFKEEIAEIVGQWRDIWQIGIVESWQDLRAQHRRNHKRLLQPADPRCFATKPPANWYGAPEKEAPKGEDLLRKKERRLVGWAGEFLFDEGETIAQQRSAKTLEKDDGSGVEITPAEHGEMLAYRVSKTQTGLHNIALAKLIKPYWQKGIKPAEIAALLNYDRSTVAQYCTCLERAKANNGNAFQIEMPNL